MKQDKAEKMIQKAERKAQKAAQQVQATAKKAEAQKQKQAAQAQKKAAKKADAATKQAAKKTKKADAAAKKAQLAAKKAEEKKAKAVAKAAAKAVESGKAPEGEGEDGAPAAAKKKSKKKLLMIAIPVLAVAIGAGVYFFVLRGGEEEEVDGPPEPIPIPLEYELAERTITALPAWGDEVLVYREEIPPEPPAPAEPEPEDAAALSETEGGEEGEEPAAAPEPEPEEVEGFTKILYRYEGLQNPGALMTAYAAVMITEDAGFSTVDEELMRIDPPEFEEMMSRGSLLLARTVPAVEEGPEAGTQSLLLEWDSENCSVTLDMPEGRVHDPKPPAAASAAPRRGIEDMEVMQPSLLGLLGESMDEYDLVIQEGSVRIANSPCVRVNAYDGNHQIAGSFFISNDGKLYRLEPDLNAVLELQWE